MKKLFISLIFSLLLFSCKKDLNYFQYRESSVIPSTITPPPTYHPIGGDTLVPDLRITAYTGTNMQYFVDSCELQPTFPPIVLRNAIVTPSLAATYGWNVGDTMDLIRVWCQTENVAPPTISHRGVYDSTNFVFNEQTDATQIIVDGQPRLILNGLIKNPTWCNINGVLVNQFPLQYKYEFEPSVNYFLPILPNNFYVGYDPPLQAIQSKTYDVYFAYFRIPRGYNGGVVCNPTINPEYAEGQRVVHEVNVSNNTFLIPLNIQGSTATYDPSALAPVSPVTNLTETHNLKGTPSLRFVTINWQSTNMWFCVHKTIFYSNGTNSGDITLPDVYNSTTFTDKSADIQAGNVKSISYIVKSMGEGLPVSAGVSVIANK